MQQNLNLNQITIITNAIVDCINLVNWHCQNAKPSVNSDNFTIDSSFCDWNDISTSEIVDIIDSVAYNFGVHQSHNYKLAVEYICEKINDHFALKQFTVISYCENKGSIFSDFVLARNKQHAFSISAQLPNRLSSNYICAIDGHISEGDIIDYAGDSCVDRETILQQSDVYA